jgi:hypothetical protein
MNKHTNLYIKKRLNTIYGINKIYGIFKIYKINLDTIIKNNKQSILTLYHNCNIVNDVKEVILKYHLLELCKHDFNNNKKNYKNYKIKNNKHITFKYCFNIFNGNCDINDTDDVDVIDEFYNN